MAVTTFIPAKLIQPAAAGNLIVSRRRVGYQLGATMKPDGAVSHPPERGRSPTAAPRPRLDARAERWQVGLLLAAFFAFNLLTATRYPFVWIDEVMYADPAVNLLLGHGFTSSAWYAQASGEFWAGNVPLHSALLWVWMQVFGFSITAVRSINDLYLVAVCLLAWRASVRLNLIATPRARLAFLGLLLGGYSVIFSYRSGRPDALAMLVVAALFCAQSLEAPWRRLASFFVLGLVAPWAGLQLLPPLGVGGGLLLLVAGWRLLPQLLAAGLGAMSGLGALVLFYQSHGVWEPFLRSIRQHTSVGFFGLLASGQFHHSNLLPKDFSFWPVFALALLLAAWLIRQRHFRWRSPLGFGLACAAGVSLALVVGGKFPTYYGWMTYAQLCLCVCATLSRTPLPVTLRWVSLGLLGAAVGVGVTLHTVTAAYDWPDRDYRHVESLVRGSVTRTDWMFGEHAAYYAAKPVAERVFLPFYLPSMLEEEKQRLAVLVLAPGNLAEVTNVVGGSWVPTGARFAPQRRGLLGAHWQRGLLSMPNYELEVFRRADRKP